MGMARTVIELDENDIKAAISLWVRTHYAKEGDLRAPAVTVSVEKQARGFGEGGHDIDVVVAEAIL
jgi:hypothetical protein